MPPLVKKSKVTDADYQEKLRLIERRRAQLRRDDIRALMSLPWGRRLVYWITFEMGRLHSPSFEPQLRDGLNTALFTARNEGIRELGGKILDEIKTHASNDYLTMLSEEVALRQQELNLKEDADREFEAGKENADG